MDLLTSKCGSCKRTLSIDKFNKCHSKKNGVQSYCKECKKESSRKRYKENKDYFIEKQREYRRENKEKVALNRKRYRHENKERLLKKQREYEKNKYHTDHKYRAIKNIRSRTNSAFKAKGIKKNNKTISMLGCSKDFLVDYIESKFKEGMSWENKSEWHIDHIIPLSSAKNEEELIELSNYKNLQPLWEIENKVKSNKI